MAVAMMETTISDATTAAEVMVSDEAEMGEGQMISGLVFIQRWREAL